MRKQRVPGVFITTSTSPVHDRCFDLHILTLAAPSINKNSNYFFFAQTFSPFFDNILLKFDVIQTSGFFLQRFKSGTLIIITLYIASAQRSLGLIKYTFASRKKEILLPL